MRGQAIEFELVSNKGKTSAVALCGPHRAPARAPWPLVLCLASPGPQSRRYGICEFGSQLRSFSTTDRRHIVLDIALGACALSAFWIGAHSPDPIYSEALAR